MIYLGSKRQNLRISTLDKIYSIFTKRECISGLTVAKFVVYKVPLKLLPQIGFERIVICCKEQNSVSISVNKSLVTLLHG